MAIDRLAELEAWTRPSRRALLRAAALVAAAGIPWRALADDAPPTLEPSAAEIIDAVCARILPSDDGPGAREAGVSRYIERQLAAGPMAAAAPALARGARVLDDAARARFGKGFAACASAEQDALIGALATATLPARAFPQLELFELIHTLTLEGFASDPIHGGNVDELGWKAIGFTPPTLRRRGETCSGHSGSK